MSVDFKIKGNYESYMKGAEDKIERAYEMAAKDFPSRIRPKVKQALRKEYPGVPVKDINQAVSRATVSGSEAVQSYKGGVIPLSHFKMRPARTPAARAREYSRIKRDVMYKGSVIHSLRQPKPYQISYTVSALKSLPQSQKDEGYFIWNGQIFHRTGERDDITRLNALSVPAMITNRAREEIEKQAQEVHAERVWHHMEQAFRK